MNDSEKEDATKEGYKRGFRNGVKEAVKEVQGWRDISIKAHKACTYTNPKEAEREHKNQLNLLGVIESKLRAKSGEDKKEIFRDMLSRQSESGPEPVGEKE